MASPPGFARLYFEGPLAAQGQQHENAGASEDERAHQKGGVRADLVYPSGAPTRGFCALGCLKPSALDVDRLAAQADGSRES